MVACSFYKQNKSQSIVISSTGNRAKCYEASPKKTLWKWALNHYANWRVDVIHPEFSPESLTLLVLSQSRRPSHPWQTWGTGKNTVKSKWRKNPWGILETVWNKTMCFKLNFKASILAHTVYTRSHTWCRLGCFFFEIYFLSKTNVVNWTCLFV